MAERKRNAEGRRPRRGALRRIWLGNDLEWPPCREATTSSIRSASFSAPSVASAFRFYQIKSPNGDRHGLLDFERGASASELGENWRSPTWHGRRQFWILDWKRAMPQEGRRTSNAERRTLPRCAVLCQLGLRQVAKLANARGAFNVEPKRIKRERWAIQAVIFASYVRRWAFDVGCSAFVFILSA